jgi:hypothetical protein
MLTIALSSRATRANREFYDKWDYFGVQVEELQFGAGDF